MSRVAKEICAAKGPIAVLGMGHVGLPTAVGLAELGWRVIGADGDASKIAVLRSGQSPFHEPGLQELLSRHVGTESFRLTANVEAAIREASILFICVGTPQRKNGEADLSAVEGLARIIARHLTSYKLIVEKSTVPAITGQWIKKTISRYGGVVAGSSTGKANGGGSTPGLLFDIASNPEFLQEGKAVENFFHPDRIICGVDSEAAREILTCIYAPINRPIQFTDVSTAELIKHAANAFLATKISFINMVADLCDALSADIEQVADGIGADFRIGRSFLSAGLGFGGYCFPKDLRAFIHLAETANVDASLLKATERINQQRIERFTKKIREALWIVQGKTIALVGLAFKGGTDDIRETQSLKVAQALLKEGAVLQMYDPKAMENAKQVFPPSNGAVKYCDSAYEAADGAHAVAVLTDWNEFRELDLVALRRVMQVPIFIDGRNLFDPEAVHTAGLEYWGMGRRLYPSSTVSSEVTILDLQRHRPPAIADPRSVEAI